MMRNVMIKSCILMLLFVCTNVLLSCSIYVDYKKNKYKEDLLYKIVLQRNKIINMLESLNRKYNGKVSTFEDLLKLKEKLQSLPVNFSKLLEIKHMVTELDKEYKAVVAEFNKLDEYLKQYVNLVQGGKP